MQLAAVWQEDHPSPAPTSLRPAPPPGGGLPAAVAAALWRGDQLGSPISAVWPSGFAALLVRFLDVLPEKIDDLGRSL